MLAKGLCCVILLATLLFACAHASLSFKGANVKALASDDLESIDLVEKRASTDKCWPGSFSPGKNDHLSTCCWYGAQTCCDSSFAGHILSAVSHQLEQVHKNGTSDKCYIAVADLLCLWCSPETNKFTEGGRYITISLCPSVCQKLWDSCSDQQERFGIKPPALTPRQLCAALLLEEEDEEGPEGSVLVTIAPESSKACYSGVSLSVVESSNCLPHYTSKTVTPGPSGGAIAAMVLVPILVIISTVVAVVVYFRVRKRREGLAYLGAGGGGGGDNFSLPADAFGEDGGFLDEEGDISEGAGSGLLDDEEDSKFSVQ